MRSPCVRYAKNKTKVCGGKYEDYVEEYERNSKRLGDIIDKKKLLLPKEEQKPFSNYKTFKDLGMLTEVSDDCVAHGIADPCGLYECISTSAESRTIYANLLDLDEIKFENLLSNVKNLLGEEYIKLNEERRKYLSMSDDEPDFIL